MQNNEIDRVEIFLNNGIDVNACDSENGVTPLLHSVLENGLESEITQMLLQRGAKIMGET